MASEKADHGLQLIRSAKDGNQSAMREIYRQHVKYLTAVCSRYVPNPEDVKDLLQESFIKIFSSLDSFNHRGNSTFRSWMTKIVVNESLKFLKLNNRLKITDITNESPDIPDEEPEIEEIPTSVIFNLIRELPDGYRTIFNLYAVEGKSHKEIASMLDIAESTSASQLHRAKAILSSKINEFRKRLEHSSL